MRKAVGRRGHLSFIGSDKRPDSRKFANPGAADILACRSGARERDERSAVTSWAPDFVQELPARPSPYPDPQEKLRSVQDCTLGEYAMFAQEFEEESKRRGFFQRVQGNFATFPV